MEFDFLEPVSQEITDFVNELSSQHLGKKVVLHTEIEFPNLEQTKIAIIGVLENRGSIGSNERVQLDFIRQELYALYPGNWESSIADLGDVLPGNSQDDTFFALKSIVTVLIKKKIIPIILYYSCIVTLVYIIVLLVSYSYVCHSVMCI